MTSPDRWSVERLPEELLPLPADLTWVQDDDGRTLLFDDGSILIMPGSHMGEWCP